MDDLKHCLIESITSLALSAILSQRRHKHRAAMTTDWPDIQCYELNWYKAVR